MRKVRRKARKKILGEYRPRNAGRVKIFTTPRIILLFQRLVLIYLQALDSGTTSRILFSAKTRQVRLEGVYMGIHDLQAVLTQHRQRAKGHS